jgi:hypothetical protein
VVAVDALLKDAQEVPLLDLLFVSDMVEGSDVLPKAAPKPHKAQPDFVAGTQLGPSNVFIM